MRAAKPEDRTENAGAASSAPTKEKDGQPLQKRKVQNPHPLKIGKDAALGVSRERHSPEWRFVGWRFCVWTVAHVSGETWGFCFTIESRDESGLDRRHGLLEYDE
jgi:hypothetical protein